MAVGEGALWVIGDALDHRLFKITPRSGRLLGEFPLPIAPQRIAAGAGAIWITDAIHDVLVKIDPATGRVLQRIATGRGADGVAVGAGSVWVVAGIAGEVERIDPQAAASAAASCRPGPARGRGGPSRRLGDARCDLAAVSRWRAIAAACS